MGFNSGFKGLNCSLTFVDPCIIVQCIKKNPTRCNNVSKFYYSIFIWSSTCFGRQTAHHQCSWWTLSGTTCLTTSTNYTSNNLPLMKTRGCQCSFRLLMMGGMSPQTCWASYKYGIIKFCYIVVFCWIFPYELKRSLSAWDWTMLSERSKFTN